MVCARGYPLAQPPPPGTARKWEDWEAVWYIGMGGAFLYLGIGLYYQPDSSVETWARYEAMKRKRALEENGESWLALMAEGKAAPPVDE